MKIDYLARKGKDGDQKGGERGKGDRESTNLLQTKRAQMRSMDEVMSQWNFPRVGCLLLADFV